MSSRRFSAPSHQRVLAIDKTDRITLEAPTYQQDGLNQFVQTGVTTREIFCAVENVHRAEWFAAAQAGMKAQYRVIIWADEYRGETVAILNGVRYSIYRTYRPNGEDMELYLEQKAGV